MLSRIYGLVFVIVVSACSTSEQPMFSTTAGATGSAAGLFTCDVATPSKKDCHLVDDGVAIVPEFNIQVSVSVAYVFGCPTANKDSSLYVYVSGETPQAQGLRFQSTGTASFVVDAQTRLRIKDGNDVGTRSRTFNPTADCSLSLTYSATPTGKTIAAWAAESSRIADLIRTKIELYELRKEVQQWYTDFVAAPGVVRGQLERRIPGLLASTRLKDRELGTSLQAIIDLAPQDVIMAPYAVRRLELVAHRAEAVQLVTEMEAWQETVLAALREALDSADSIL